MTDDQTPAATPAEKMAAELSALAVQARTDARAHGRAATEHRPLVEQAAARVADAYKQVEELERQHAESLAVLAKHEKDGRDAADVAEKIALLAADLRRPPDLPAPDQVHAEAGLMAEKRSPSLDGWNEANPVGTPVRYWPAERTGPGTESHTRTPAWLVSGQPVVSVDGYSGGIALTHVEIIRDADELVVLGELMRKDGCICTSGRSPEDYDGPQRDCPVHGEHPTPDDLPFNVVQAPDEVVEVLTGGHQIVRHPAAPGLDAVVAVGHPGVTMPDTGLAPLPLDPPPGNGVHRHAKQPKRLDISGAFKTITGRLERDEQDGEDRG